MVAKYSVPEEAQKCPLNGILHHKGHKSLPKECYDYVNLVKYVGDDQPKMAINWRLAESVASLKGFEAVLLNLLLSRKYHPPPQEVTINTAHA